MALSQAPAEEPLTNAITPITEPGANQSQDETDVYFAFNKWTLSDEAKENIKTRMEDKAEGWTGTLRIVGHTDAQGTDAYNKALGLKRAESVKTYLVSLGIPEADVQVDTLGKTVRSARKRPRNVSNKTGGRMWRSCLPHRRVEKTSKCR